VIEALEKRSFHVTHISVEREVHMTQHFSYECRLVQFYVEKMYWVTHLPEKGWYHMLQQNAEGG